MIGPKIGIIVFLYVSGITWQTLVFFYKYNKFCTPGFDGPLEEFTRIIGRLFSPFLKNVGVKVGLFWQK